MIAVQRVFGYLRQKCKGKNLVDVKEAPVRGVVSNHEIKEWTEFYPDAVENTPSDRPTPRGKQCSITCYVDADHARDKVTRRSVTGIVVLLNNTPVS